ncbi:unnamed protein product, partial [Mesorhabditis belari]|uniref:Uncharacterized protein n=1 Tax=Mesorhabditis belari TaxID=2138241 RepID=A0AAF3EUE7_9BILA
MVAKKKNFADFSHADFARIFTESGPEDIQKIAFNLIRKLRKGNKNTLSCLSTLLHFTHETKGIIEPKEIEILAERLLVEYQYTNAINQCLDLFEFAVGIVEIYPETFVCVVERMTDKTHLYVNTLKKTRQIVALLPQVVKFGIQVKRKTFHNLMVPVYKHLADFSVNDLYNLADYLTLLLVQINKRENSHGIQLYDMLRLKKVNPYLSNLYMDLSAASTNNDSTQKSDNDKLRCMINRYFCAFLASFPECTDPLIEGQRPLIDSLRRGLFYMALDLFTNAASGQKESSSSVVGEALKMLAYFVFPMPAHFAFTDERFHALLRNAMFNTNEETRKLAVLMAVSLVHAAWLYVHSELPVDESPFDWLRDEHPELLFDLANLLQGIVAAIPCTALPFREKLIEVVSLYAMEDDKGDLIPYLKQAGVEKLAESINGMELTKNEELYLNVLFDTLCSAK